MRSWAADSQCQLCRAAVGTEEHRHRCDATAPSGGWCTHPIPYDVARLLTVSQQRALTTRAILALPLQPPPTLSIPTVEWVTEPPSNPPDDATWYVDGSVMHPAIPEIATAGCAIVIVSAQGELLHAASVALPSRVTTAPEAELCAIEIVLSMTPAPLA